MSTDENMTVEEVRQHFRLKSVDTVRRWHREGKLRGFKVAHNILLFKRDDVIEYERSLIEQAS